MSTIYFFEGIQAVFNIHMVFLILFFLLSWKYLE
jgi:hypothetical protein